MVVMDTDNDDLREPLYGKPFGALCSPGTPLTHLKRHTHTHTHTARHTHTHARGHRHQDKDTVKNTHLNPEKYIEIIQQMMMMMMMMGADDDDNEHNHNYKMNT